MRKWFFGPHGNWLGRPATMREYTLAALGFALLVALVLVGDALSHGGRITRTISEDHAIGVEVDLSPGRVATALACFVIMYGLHRLVEWLDGPRVERVRVGATRPAALDAFDGPGYGWDGDTIELDEVLDVARVEMLSGDVAYVRSRKEQP